MSGTDPIPAYVRGRIGQLLQGKYRLNALLGLGGMAAVYAATHRNGKRLAIKMLHPELSVVPELKSRFLTEGYVANKVNHPGVVAVLDDQVADDGAVFLVMELLEGETLGARARRRGGRLDAAEVLAIADQLLDVLAAAHAKGVIHRDLKPDNIFITTAGVVKVLDFGIARVNRASQSHHDTASGIAMGTPAFLAPEQARGRWETVDALTDQWAVGATMFALLAGREVHCAQTMSELLLAAMTQTAVPLASVVDVPPEVASVVDRSLSYDRSQRFPDARSMQLAVRDAAGAMGDVPLRFETSSVPASLRMSPTSLATEAPLAPPLHQATGPGISMMTSYRAAARRLPTGKAIALGAAIAASACALLGAGALWAISSRREADADVAHLIAASEDTAASQAAPLAPGGPLAAALAASAAASGPTAAASAAPPGADSSKQPAPGKPTKTPATIASAAPPRTATRPGKARQTKGTSSPAFLDRQH